MSKLPDEELERRVQTYREHDCNLSRAAAALGLNRDSLRSTLARASKMGMFLDHAPAMPGFEIAKVTTAPNGGKTITQVQDSGELTPFEMPDTHLLGKVTYQVGPDGMVERSWPRATPDVDLQRAAMRAVADELKKELPRYEPIRAPSFADDKLLNQYTLTDLHLGMLAWAEETRDADWDLKIAERLIVDWFSTAISFSPPSEVGLFAQLGDLIHFDGFSAVTPTSGHLLDADSRFQKIIRVVIRVIRQVIRMLLDKHPRVHVIMADANHDPASEAWMREWLFAVYEDEPRVTVDCSADTYYGYEWGYTGLFYHHGHKRKIEQVDSVFVSKFREMYGRTRHHYAHVGHLHNEGRVETNLMVVDRHRTLAPKDAYASKGGWLSKRDAKVITYHREFGKVFESVLSPEMVQSSRI